MAVCLWNGGEMKKGQIRTGVVRNVKFPNRAMVLLEPLEGAADDEEICEVKGALPGQKISVVITKVRKGKGEGSTEMGAGIVDFKSLFAVAEKAKASV